MFRIMRDGGLGGDRTREANGVGARWIPAFAGMTKKGEFVRLFSPTCGRFAIK
jgi:hypothetical protein